MWPLLTVQKRTDGTQVAIVLIKIFKNHFN
jgi:hypothetical protein